MADYVFGYGSLLERASRTRTNPEAVGAWPARVKGFKRGWFHQFIEPVSSTCTFLGARKAKPGDEITTINGVIYPVKDLTKTEDRETDYKKTALEENQITMLDGGGDWRMEITDNVYIFVSDEKAISKTEEPTPEIPMVQSYVDICINGCLELEAIYRTVKGTFTQEFISTTSGWNKFWVNDRIYPRKPHQYSPNFNAIDRALKAGEKLGFRQLNDLVVSGKFTRSVT